MKLHPLSKDKLTWLKEFDHWVTPYLEEVRDSDIFHKTISNIKTAIDLWGIVNNEFTVPNSASVNFLVDAVMLGLKNRKADEIHALIISFCDLTFLLTGKSDNNYKCQFPIYLKEIKKLDKYPSIRRKNYEEVNDIPRVIKSEDISVLITKIEGLKSNIIKGNLKNLKLKANLETTQRKLLVYYFEYILNQEIYSRSLTIFGSKYFELKKTGNEDDLMAPMIISYVRGSASASGGHHPESLLREHMNSWGLVANEDYNTNDVKPLVTDIIQNKKSRAYDFVLPYNVKGWENKIYIQAQFYAGDSGSVSHKNVDQTTTSRAAVLINTPQAKFVEYVDGGGYYGSLNGDLKKLLFMDNTENFFQVRTFPIKLRQLLQAIGFLTPLELVHALVISDFNLKMTIKKLTKDGYSETEVKRVLQNAEKNILEPLNKNELSINDAFYKLSRRYFLLDCISYYGKDVTVSNKGIALIPGYGEYFGSKTSEVIGKVKKMGGKYYNDWQTPQILIEDLEFLAAKEWIMNI